MLSRKQEQVMLYTIELIRFIPGRVGVLSQITHADNDPEAAKEKAKRFLMETKVANATRVRLLNADGVEVFNWGPHLTWCSLPGELPDKREHDAKERSTSN
jgi:hypothetical protein